MASITIYAPTVNSFEPAFPHGVDGNRGACRVYFVLSDYNAREDIGYAHASVANMATNFNVVYTGMNQTTDIKTASGTILNLPVKEVEEQPGLYYIEILDGYIHSGEKEGWTVGSLYKIQIRLTEKDVKYESTEGNLSEAQAQITWLNTNANKFSEWSTTIVTKVIGEDFVEIPILEGQTELKSSNLDIVGTYSNADPSEKMYSVKIQTYKEDILVDDSDILYKDSFDSSNKFAYSSKVNLQDGDYIIKVIINTVNKHTCIKEYQITIKTEESEELKNLSLSYLAQELGYEEDEGCIILKIVSSIQDDVYKGTLRIRRASEKENFAIWEDICEMEFKEETPVNEFPLFKDFSAESGIFYKYGLQEIIRDGSHITRSKLKVIDETARIFEYSFLLGKGGRQLKLKYDLGLSNLKKPYSDTITPTIGGIYPFTTRVGAADYYTFSMNGKISFSMDENNLFLSKDSVYGYNKNSNINQYDFTYERKFREEVYKFLTDGKPKLFKSPTEGNLVVRLTNVSMSPINNLSRLICDFSATVTEIDEATVVKYRKYGFIPEIKNSILS